MHPTAAPTLTINVFILLDLDPDKANDRIACEARVEEKRRQWAQQSGGIGKLALEAKAKLAQIPEIKRILADDQLRMEQRLACGHG